MRYLLREPDVPVKPYDWTALAHFVVGSLRADVARAGLASEVPERVDQLCSSSSEFAILLRSNEVSPNDNGHSRERRLHPQPGSIELECSDFAVDRRPDLRMMIHAR